MSLYHNIKYYLRRLYRLSVSMNKWDDLVWNDLKELHLDANWNSGVHERDKVITCHFAINDTKGLQYIHFIHNGNFNVRVTLVDEFEEEFINEMFILTTHINNIIARGLVTINPTNRSVTYTDYDPLIIPLLYSGDIYDRIIRHYNLSKIVYAAFNRLLYEGEPPAIIIADMLKENEEKNTQENKTK